MRLRFRWLQIPTACVLNKESCWRSNPKSPGLLFWVFYTLEEPSSQQYHGHIYDIVLLSWASLWNLVIWVVPTIFWLNLKWSDSLWYPTHDFPSFILNYPHHALGGLLKLSGLRGGKRDAVTLPVGVTVDVFLLKIVSFIYFLMLDYVILVCNVSAVHKQVIIFQRLHGNIDFRIRELTNLSQVFQRASNKQCYLPFSFSWISLWTDISERPFHAEGFCKPISSHLFSWKSEI